MESRRSRQAFKGLRKADPTTLMVQVQELVRLPLGQIDRATLLDLLALSEVPDQLPPVVAADLSRFPQQMLREINDLPDGPVMAEFCRELIEIAPSKAPSCLRVGVLALRGDFHKADSVQALADLALHWEQDEPEQVKLPASSSKAPAAASAPAPATRSEHSIVQVVKPAGGTKEKKAATPAAMVDTRREEWIREDVISRLVNYGAKGLKEPIVVAGARHRSPWKDMTETEVLAVLRKLKREGRLRDSAGRWMINS